MTFRSIRPLLCATFAVVAGVGVSAHHSFDAEYDSKRPITVTGYVTKLDWINPHVYIHLDVKDEKGAVTAWRLETLPTAMLRKAGLTKDMIIGGGMAVTVDAYLARDGTQNLAWVLKLTYDDGHYYQLAGE